MKETTKNTPVNNEEVSLKNFILKLQEWWKYLLSRWVVILIAALVGGSAGFIYAYFKKPVYRATLSFALEDDKSSGGLEGALGLASQFGFDLGGGGGGAFTGDNLLELMKSRSIVEKALLTEVPIKGKRQTLAELYISFNNLREGWNKNPRLRNISFQANADRSKFSLQQDSVLGVFYNNIIKNNLVVDKTDKKLSIIGINVNSENELFSKNFTEVLAKTVSDFYIDTKTKKSVQNVRILQHQTDSVRRELNAAIYGVASAIDANPNANPTRQVLRATSQHKQVDVQANQAILTQLVQNLELSKMSLRKETPLIQIIDSPILPLEKVQVGKIKEFILGGIVGALLMATGLIIKNVYDKTMYDQ